MFVINHNSLSFGKWNTNLFEPFTSPSELQINLEIIFYQKKKKKKNYLGNLRILKRFKKISYFTFQKKNWKLEDLRKIFLLKFKI